MSWIEPYASRYYQRDGECDCPGACDCLDQRDLHVIDAWHTFDQATLPERLRDPHGTAPTGTPSKRPPHALRVTRGRDIIPLPVSRPAPSLDELAARRATRPLSSAVGDVVPLRPRTTIPTSPEAA